MWKNTVEPGRPQMAIWHVRIACWMTTATNTHSEYVIFATTTLVARTRLDIALYTPWLPVLFNLMTTAIQPYSRDMGLKRYSATRLCSGVPPAGLRGGLVAAGDTSPEMHPPTLLKPGSIVMAVKTAPCLLSASPASLATQLDILAGAEGGQPCMAVVIVATATAKYTH
jgi:hypothetical protein